MGVITTEHLDDSELRDDELAQWGPRVRESLAKDYIARIESLNDQRLYPNTDAGWEQLKERAWSEAIAANEVCKAISCISAQRRAERMIADGSIATVELARPLTAADIEAVLRAANPEGELTHLDGKPVLEGHLDELASMINDPAQRAAMIKPYQVTADLIRTTTDIISRLFGRLRARAEPTDTPPQEERSSTLQAMGVQAHLGHTGPTR